MAGIYFPAIESLVSTVVRVQTVKMAPRLFIREKKHIYYLLTYYKNCRPKISVRKTLSEASDSCFQKSLDNFLKGF
jgi:hypothetical protein